MDSVPISLLRISRNRIRRLRPIAVASLCKSCAYNPHRIYKSTIFFLRQQQERQKKRQTGHACVRMYMCVCFWSLLKIDVSCYATYLSTCTAFLTLDLYSFVYCWCKQNTVKKNFVSFGLLTGEYTIRKGNLGEMLQLTSGLF